MRPAGRSANQVRPVTLTRNYTKHAEGSVLVEFGDTKVLCTASIDEGVPRFLKGQGQGWITAEYGMLPRSTHTRNAREAAKGKQGGRTMEIQRLIARALRAAVDLKALGEFTITLDCDVLQADGGTRTASITGACVALADALNKLVAAGKLKTNPMKGMVAAVSVGIVNGEAICDLEYIEDSAAETDMNVVMTEGAKGMKGAIQKAEEIVASNPEQFLLLQQFSNPANPEIHEKTTGPEIWEDTDGQVDVFISGVGTGGTLTGVSRYIKNTKGKKDLITVAVEPTDSPVIAQALAGEELKPGPHKIQGIGAGFIPGNLDLKLVDKVIGITNEEAISTARRLMEEEGILAGISSGAAVAAALKLQEDEAFTNKNIVVILPSSGERYLSTALFADLFTEKELQQ